MKTYYVAYTTCDGEHEVVKTEELKFEDNSSDLKLNKL